MFSGAAIDAVCAVTVARLGQMETVEWLVTDAFDAGAVDLVVTAYRGNPDLLDDAAFLADGA